MNSTTSMAAMSSSIMPRIRLFLEDGGLVADDACFVTELVDIVLDGGIVVVGTTVVVVDVVAVLAGGGVGVLHISSAIVCCIGM